METSLDHAKGSDKLMQDICLSEQDLKGFCRTLNQEHFTTDEYKQGFEDLAEDYGFNKHVCGIDITNGEIVTYPHPNGKRNIFYYDASDKYRSKLKARTDNQKPKWKAVWVLPRSDKA